MLQPCGVLLSQQEFGASTRGCVFKTSYFSSVAPTCPAGDTGRAGTSHSYKVHFPIGVFIPPWNKMGMFLFPPALTIPSVWALARMGDENHQV